MPVRCSLEQADLPSGIDRFRPAVDPELAIDLFDVVADRVGGDREMVGDLAAGEVGVEQAQHLEFALTTSSSWATYVGRMLRPSAPRSRSCILGSQKIWTKRRGSARSRAAWIAVSAAGVSPRRWRATAP